MHVVVLCVCMCVYVYVCVYMYIYVCVCPFLFPFQMYHVRLAKIVYIDMEPYSKEHFLQTFQAFRDAHKDVCISRFSCVFHGQLPSLSLWQLCVCFVV